MCFRAKSCGYIVRYFYGLTALVVQADCACRSRAAFSSGGSSLPRFEALCRIPRQAFGLKQYFSGAFAIKICVVSPSGGRCHEVTEGLTDRPRKMRFLLWGTPQYCASSTRQAIEKPSATMLPAADHFSCRGTETVSSLTLHRLSRTHRKSSPLLELNAPGTFSQTANLGYLPSVAHLISFIILTAS